MFSKSWTTISTENSSDKIVRLRRELTAADAVIVGAGAGLSTSAGFIYSGERFHKHFSDFEECYGIKDMYSGGFYPFPTPEEHWGYWSRYIMVNRYEDPPKPVYTQLLELVRDKDYFVITTNVDHCFQKAGFDKSRLFYTQGDYGLFQCSESCCQITYDNEATILAMVEQQQGKEILTELLPKCPNCGRPMTMNLRTDNRFVEDEGWHAAAGRYSEFLHSHQGKRILLLELGVGYNTPVIIKYPFWRMTHQNPKATYVCINKDEAYAPKEIAKRSICIDDDIGDVLEALQHWKNKV